MNKLNALKLVSGGIVSAGAGTIVGNLIKATTPPEVQLVNKICITVGGAVLGSMLGEYASRYTGDKIDETAAQLTGLFDPPTDV